MKTTGKTIQIFCPTGEPRGVRIAEITTRIVQAVVVPRAKLDEAVSREELAGVGLYFLVGESDAMGRPMVYIGEAEDCSVRLKQHNKDDKKEFWKTAVVIVSRTGSFTKAHVRMLEWMGIQQASAAGRYELDNGNGGMKPVIPEWMRSDVEEIFETADVLLSALGHPVFEPAVAKVRGQKTRIFSFKCKGAESKGVYSEDGLTILKGSSIPKGTAPSCPEIGVKREGLISEKILHDDGKFYVFSQDKSFSSPSAAACIVAGANTNGWDVWRDEAGVSLNDVYRKEKAEK